MKNEQQILELIADYMGKLDRLTDRTEKETMEIRRVADAAERKADAADRKADAAWELVVMTRNEIQVNLANLRMPWWKKLFGQTG